MSIVFAGTKKIESIFNKIVYDWALHNGLS